MFDLLVQGAPLFLTWQAIVLTAAGIIAGLFIGVLPGLGPLMGIVLLLPVAFTCRHPGNGNVIALCGRSAGGRSRPPAGHSRTPLAAQPV